MREYPHAKEPRGQATDGKSDQRAGKHRVSLHTGTLDTKLREKIPDGRHVDRADGSREGLPESRQF